MLKKRLFIVTTIFCIVITIVGCNRASNVVLTPTAAPSLPVSPIPTASQALPTFTPTLKPVSTATSLPSPTSTPSASPTQVPFLPEGLAVLNPQNVMDLKYVQALPEAEASVVAFSPDSSLIAAGFFRNNHVKVWDLKSGQERLALRGQADARILSYLAFSPDGTKLAAGTQGWEAANDNLILWEIASGRMLQRFSGVLGALSPDWSLVATTRREQEETTLVLSDLASGKELHTLKADGDIYKVVFSPDGRRVAAKMYSVFQDLFSFWSVEAGRLDSTQYDWLEFSYSPDGKFVAVVVDTGTGSDLGELNIHDGTAFRWIKTLAKSAHSLWYTCPAFSPDGRLLAASIKDRVILWDTQTWTRLVTLPSSAPSGLAFSPDGRLLVIHSMKGPVQLWGVAGG